MYDPNLNRNPNANANTYPNPNTNPNPNPNANANPNASTTYDRVYSRFFGLVKDFPGISLLTIKWGEHFY